MTLRLAFIVRRGSASPVPPTAAAMRQYSNCSGLVRAPAGEYTVGAHCAESKRLGLPDDWATRE